AETAIGSWSGLARASLSPRTSVCAQKSAIGSVAAHNTRVCSDRRSVFKPDTGAPEMPDAGNSGYETGLAVANAIYEGTCSHTAGEETGRERGCRNAGRDFSRGARRGQ